MIPYYWTSAVIAITIAGAIIWLVRHNRLHPRNAVWWMCVAIVIAAVGLAPAFVDFIASELGVHYPPILAILGGMAVILIKMLRVDIERSKEQQQMRILAQKVAVLEAELRTERDAREYSSETPTESLQSKSR